MVIFINQIRMKIGVMFGNPETTTGGNALKFYASVRLDIRRIGQIKDREEVVGNQTRVKVVKNKVAPPFKQVEFDIMYGEGISKTGELIDLGVEGRYRREVGRLVLLRRRAHRPGPRERQGVPQGEPEDRRRHREGHPAERRAHRRQAADRGTIGRGAGRGRRAGRRGRRGQEARPRQKVIRHSCCNGVGPLGPAPFCIASCHSGTVAGKRRGVRGWVDPADKPWDDRTGCQPGRKRRRRLTPRPAIPDG